jgi:hypothetical protein
MPNEREKKKTKKRLTPRYSQSPLDLPTTMETEPYSDQMTIFRFGHGFEANVE